MNSKPIRYTWKISFGPIRGPHRGPYTWEIELTPQEAKERMRRQTDRALLYCELLPAEEITAVMESYRRSLEQMATIAIEASEITLNAKIAEAAGHRLLEYTQSALVVAFDKKASDPDLFMKECLYRAPFSDLQKPQSHRLKKFSACEN